MFDPAKSIRRRCRQLMHCLAADGLLDGGRLSGALAAHAASCPRCGAELMKLGRVCLGLSLLRGQRQPRNLLGRANQMALQKMRRAVRYSPEADALRTACPRVSVWVFVHHVWQRTLSGAVCLMVLCLLRVGISDGVRQTAELGEKLAAYHEAEHIYGHESDWA